MPKVPQAQDDGVALRAMPNAALSQGTFSPAFDTRESSQAVTSAVTKLTDSLSDVARRYQYEADKAVLLEAEREEGEFSERLLYGNGEDDQGYLSVRGKEVMPAMEKVQKQYDEKWKEIEARIPSRLRNSLASYRNSAARSLNLKLQTHGHAELQKYKDQNYKSVIDLNLTRSKNSIGDPTLSEQYLTDAVKNAEEYVRSHNSDDATVELFKRKTLNTGVFENTQAYLDQMGVGVAKQYFDGKAALVDQDTREKVKELFKKADREETANKLVFDSVSKYGVEGAVKNIDKQYDAGKIDGATWENARRGALSMVEQNQQAQKLARYKAFDDVIGIARANPGETEWETWQKIPQSLKAKLTPEQEIAARRYIGNPVTNEEVLFDIMENPDKFKGMQFSEFKQDFLTFLSREDRNKAQKVYDKANGISRGGAGSGGKTISPASLMSYVQKQTSVQAGLAGLVPNDRKKWGNKHVKTVNEISNFVQERVKQRGGNLTDADTELKAALAEYVAKKENSGLGAWLRKAFEGWSEEKQAGVADKVVSEQSAVTPEPPKTEPPREEVSVNEDEFSAAKIKISQDVAALDSPEARAFGSQRKEKLDQVNPVVTIERGGFNLNREKRLLELTQDELKFAKIPLSSIPDNDQRYLSNVMQGFNITISASERQDRMERAYLAKKTGNLRRMEAILKGAK